VPSACWGNASQSRRALRRVLSDQKAFDSFLLFCKAEFAAENVLFWKAVTEFRRAAMATSGGEAGVTEGPVLQSSAPSSSAAAAESEVALSHTLHRSMLSIWSTFVRSNATLQVNLSSRNQLLVRKRLEHIVRTFHGIGVRAEVATLQTEAATVGLFCEHVTATPAQPQAPSINSATVVPLSTAAEVESKAPIPGFSGGLTSTGDPELVAIPFVFDDAVREILCVMVRTKQLAPLPAILLRSFMLMAFACDGAGSRYFYSVQATSHRDRMPLCLGGQHCCAGTAGLAGRFIPADSFGLPASNACTCG
jgi:hypothetical protein